MSSPDDRPAGPSGEGHARALRILARSMVRELMSRGYAPRHIVALASELISLACETIRNGRMPRPET